MRPVLLRKQKNWKSKPAAVFSFSISLRRQLSIAFAAAGGGGRGGGTLHTVRYGIRQHLSFIRPGTTDPPPRAELTLFSAAGKIDHPSRPPPPRSNISVHTFAYAFDISTGFAYPKELINFRERFYGRQNSRNQHFRFSIHMMMMMSSSSLSPFSSTTDPPKKEKKGNRVVCSSVQFSRSRKAAAPEAAYTVEAAAACESFSRQRE